MKTFSSRAIITMFFISTMFNLFAQNDSSEMPCDTKTKWNLLAGVKVRDAKNIAFSGYSQSNLEHWSCGDISQVINTDGTVDLDKGTGPFIGLQRHLFSTGSETIDVLAHFGWSFSRYDSSRGPLLAAETTQPNCLNYIQDRVDIDMHVVELGGNVRFRFTNRLSFICTGALTVNVINPVLQRKETLYATGPLTGMVAQDISKADSDKIKVGFLVAAGARFDLIKDWFIEGTASYEFLDSFSASTDTSEAEIDLSGASAEVSVGRRF